VATVAFGPLSLIPAGNAVVRQGRLDVDHAPPVSVVIVSFNSAACLPACLESLAEQSYPDFQVICLDNASTDHSLQVLRRYPWVEVLASRENLGFAGGCNVAITQAGGSVIVLLNPDTVVERDWLAELVAPLRADQSIGITGSKILSDDGETLLAAGGWYNAFGLSKHHGAGQRDAGQHDEPRDVPYVTGASLAVRRSVLDQVGGFDPGYFPAYFEEIDLCHRARQQGMRVLYVPGSRCRHLESQSVGAGSANYVRWYHRNRWRFLLRNFSWRRLLLRAVPLEAAWFGRNYVFGLARALWRCRTLKFWRVCPDVIALLKAYVDVFPRAGAIRASRRERFLFAQPGEGAHGGVHHHRRSRFHWQQPRAPVG
jgi:GT2 family glycosyltransferase